MTIEEITSGEIQCYFCGNRVVVEWWKEAHQKDMDHCPHWPDNRAHCLFVAAYRWFGWDLATNTFRAQFGEDRANILGRDDDWLCAGCIAETIRYPLQ